MRPPVLRPTIKWGRDTDSDGFIVLISACWAEYPGCVMDVDGENPELRALASHYAAKGGALWVAEAGGAVVGMIAVAPHAGKKWEICKLYVDAAHRGTGLARELIRAAETYALKFEAEGLVLWSDTRFERAHRFYEKRGYVRSGPIRVLHDASNSLEFAYAKPLIGVQVRRLDAAGAASAEHALAEILRACVDDGASVSFLPPLSVTAARDFTRRLAREVAGSQRVLLGGWIEGVLCGTVTLDLDTPPNQPHRADVQKLLVHPTARRRGLARALMLALEDEARAAGRSLLTLDTRAGSDAEPLYRRMGYHEAGRIPGYALSADGTKHDTVLFWKELP